jgi:hypothetical protein
MYSVPSLALTYQNECVAPISFATIIQQRIFMTDDLRKKFGVIDDEINMALSEYDIGKAAKDYNLQKSAIEKVSSSAEAPAL